MKRPGASSFAIARRSIDSTPEAFAETEVRSDHADRSAFLHVTAFLFALFRSKSRSAHGVDEVNARAGQARHGFISRVAGTESFVRKYSLYRFSGSRAVEQSRAPALPIGHFVVLLFCRSIVPGIALSLPSQMVLTLRRLFGRPPRPCIASVLRRPYDVAIGWSNDRPRRPRRRTPGKRYIRRAIREACQWAFGPPKSLRPVSSKC